MLPHTLSLLLPPAKSSSEVQGGAERAAGAQREALGLLSSLLGSQLNISYRSWAGFNPGLSQPHISGLAPVPGRGRGVPRCAQTQAAGVWPPE